MQVTHPTIRPHASPSPHPIRSSIIHRALPLGPLKDYLHLRIIRRLLRQQFRKPALLVKQRPLAKRLGKESSRFRLLDGRVLGHVVLDRLFDLFLRVFYVFGDILPFCALASRVGCVDLGGNGGERWLRHALHVREHFLERTGQEPAYGLPRRVPEGELPAFVLDVRFVLSSVARREVALGLEDVEDIFDRFGNCFLLVECVRCLLLIMGHGGHIQDSLPGRCPSGGP